MPSITSVLSRSESYRFRRRAHSLRKYAPWQDRVDIQSEVRERSVRPVREQAAEHPSQWAAIRSIARRFGCTPETLRWRPDSERPQAS